MMLVSTRTGSVLQARESVDGRPDSCKTRRDGFPTLWQQNWQCDSTQTFGFVEAPWQASCGL